MTDLQWDRSHGDVETVVIPRQADPPLSGGVEHHSAGDAAVSHGGADGFPLAPESRSAWDVVCNQGVMLAPLREHLEDLEENPALRAAAVLRALERGRDALMQVDENAELDAPVTVLAADLALLLRQLLQRLR